MRLDASDLEGLQPLINEIVRETVERISDQRAKLDGRLGFPEAEAASILGVERHVLRDTRLAGKIKARKIGTRWVYSRAELLRFMGEKP